MENCFNGSCIANVDSNFIDCFDISIEWGRYVKTLLNSYLHVLQSFQILFVWSFSCHPLIVHSFGDVTISGEGLQSLTYTRHSCPLRSEGSLACHTYCATAHQFYWLSPRTVTLRHIAGRLAVELPLPVFILRSVAAGIRTSYLPLGRKERNTIFLSKHK